MLTTWPLVPHRSTAQRLRESWPQQLREQPDAALLVAGALELYDLRAGKRVLRMGTPQHDAVLRERWRLALEIATSGGRAVVVTDVPCFDIQDPGDPRAEALRARPARAQGPLGRYP